MRKQWNPIEEMGIKKDDVLAVVVPHYGQATETFIKRYCLDLLPERTVLVHFYPGAGTWEIPGSVYSLPKATCGSVRAWKAFRGIQKLCGIDGLFGDPYSSRSLAGFLKKNGVTCVFSQYLIAGWNVHSVVKDLGLRHVIRGHGFDLSSTLGDEKWRRRYLEICDVDAIVVPTPFQVERLRAIGMKSANLVSVPYGVDLPDSLGVSSDPQNRDDGMIRIIAAGRFVAKKSPLAAVKAFLLAAESDPRLQLTFIGNGPMEAEVKRYVEQHDRKRQIRLVGAKSHAEVLQAMEESDIFLQHSITDPDSGDQEGAPVAILEAMARGLPIVSTLHSGIPFVVEHGRSGLLTPEGDVQGMAASILKLAGSGGLRMSMCSIGRKRAETLSWQLERETLTDLLFPNAEPI